MNNLPPGKRLDSIPIGQRRDRARAFFYFQALCVREFARRKKHGAVYLQTLVSFRQQYQGKFLFEITIVKKYNDDPQSIQWLMDTAARINPDRLMIVELDGEKVRKTLGVGEERLEEIRRQFSKQSFRVVF